jgi:uncharacterized membrane protein
VRIDAIFLPVTFDSRTHLRAAHAFFAATMAGLGILGLFQGGATPTWAGVPATLPGHTALVYCSCLVSLLTGIGLLWRRTSLISARVLLGAFVLWWLAFRLPVVFRYPTNSGAWWAVGDTAAMTAAALIIATGDQWPRIARALYGLGLIPLGVAHFTYLDRTVSLVPAWLPWHLAWAYFTGIAFIAAGLGVATGVLARLAATLSMWEMGLFTVLVWVPILVAGHSTVSDKREFVGSWVITAAAWVMADSLRGKRWLAVRKA